jgi:hypothetical protein
MIFGRGELRRAKGAALTFHQPLALHRARSGAASTRTPSMRTCGRVGAARTFTA